MGNEKWVREPPRASKRAQIHGPSGTAIEYGAARSRYEVPKSSQGVLMGFLGANLEVGEAQKKKKQRLGSLENVLKMKSHAFHKT